MKFSAKMALLLGVAGMAHAQPLSDRSQRAFRVLSTNASGEHLVAADLVVAFEGSIPSGFDLKKTMENTSSALFQATKGAVQLGKVTITPASPYSDPDILIVSDCSKIVARTESATSICADAHTGGYVGTKWWEATTGLAGHEVFAKIASTKAARVTIAWSTLQALKEKVLVHELGHYLFSMRDEYEGTSFLSENGDATEYLGANVADPNPTATSAGTGLALEGASATFALTTAANNTFTGYAMGFVTLYSPTLGFSPYQINVQTPVAGMPKPDGAGINSSFENIWWVVEQFASRPTRGNENNASAQYRHGGLWSMATTIRTALGDANYKAPAAATAIGGTVVAVSTTELPAENKVVLYQTGQANMFVFDRSGSMSSTVQNGYYAGFTRYQLAMDFFGLMTHPDNLAVKYPSSAKFGVVTFDDLLEVPAAMAYPQSITALGAASVTGATSPLVYKPATPDLIGGPRGLTNLVGALDSARKTMNKDATNPYQRNVILISDGEHNYPNPNEFTGNEGKEGAYRVFTVTIDTKPDDIPGYGKKMQDLANLSAGPDGAKGLPFFTSNLLDASAQLSGVAQQISEALYGAEPISFGEALLFRDAAREYVINTQSNQSRATFSVSYAGASAPILTLTAPNGQTITETSTVPGVTFVAKGTLKTVVIDPTKFASGQWKLKVSTQSSTPVQIFPVASVMSSSLKVGLTVDSRFSSSTGRIPLQVVVQDVRPVMGLTVEAKLVSANTGVVSTKTLTWNGTAYAGEFSGNIQPGRSDLFVTVTHPNNGKVYYLPEENATPASGLPQVPFFPQQLQTRQVWVDGASSKLANVQVEAWTKQEAPEFAQGTNLKLFLKNNSTVPLTGLRARYFFSVSEIAGGLPGWSDIYRPGAPIVRVGTVTNRPGLAYVEFDYAGKTLQPGASSSNGTNGGDQIYVVEAGWKTPWNPTNDYSYSGLKTTWAANGFVNIYDATGKLLVGNPDLDPANSTVSNASPYLSLVVPDLLVSGQSATLAANAIDPDGDAVTVKWFLGTTQVATGSTFTYSAWVAGSQTLTVTADDGISTKTTVVKTLQAQAASGACTESGSLDLGASNSSKSVSLVAGANCFKISGAKMSREWKWSNVVFQANSSGVSLAGSSVQSLPVGSAKALSGYSMSVNFADPGFGKTLYLKVVSNAPKAVNLNWWLQ